MAIARKCDRCEKLYEEYDHIECNDKQITGLYTAKTSEKGIHFTQEHYDLCPECCFELAKWLVDTETTVVKLKEEIIYMEPGAMGGNMYPKVDSENINKEEKTNNGN